MNNKELVLTVLIATLFVILLAVLMPRVMEAVIDDADDFGGLLAEAAERMQEEYRREHSSETDFTENQNQTAASQILNYTQTTPAPSSKAQNPAEDFPLSDAEIKHTHKGMI